MRTLFVKFYVAILAILVLWPGSSSTGSQAAADRAQQMLARPVKSFNVEGLTMIDALMQLGQQQQVPLGVEYVDLEAVQKPTSVRMEKTTLGEVLRAILAHEKGYTWRVRDGVVDISHAGVPSRPKNLLDRVLRDFTIPESTLQDANHSLWMALDYQLHPTVRGIAGDYSPGNMQNVIGPLKMQNATVRQGLNRLVREKHNAAWVVQVAPGQLDQIPSEGLWRIIEYSDPSVMGHAADLLRHTIYGWGPMPSSKNAH